MDSSNRILVLYKEPDRNNFKKLELEENSLKSHRALGEKLEVIELQDGTDVDGVILHIRNQENVKAVDRDSTARIQGEV